MFASRIDVVRWIYVGIRRSGDEPRSSILLRAASEAACSAAARP